MKNCLVPKKKRNWWDIWNTLQYLEYQYKRIGVGRFTLTVLVPEMTSIVPDRIFPWFSITRGHFFCIIKHSAIVLYVSNFKKKSNLRRRFWYLVSHYVTTLLPFISEKSFYTLWKNTFWKMGENAKDFAIRETSLTL